MKYVDEFRDGARARAVAGAIAREADPARRYAFMEFCGGHTHTIARYGITDLLPGNVVMVHGPGCPVCVLPIGRIDAAIALARDRGVTLCTYADTLRIPASGNDSLLRARAAGADVRRVYAAADALRIAREHPASEVVFFAIGFETTTPATAHVVQAAARLGLRNFSVFCNHVLTPSAITSILASSRAREIGTVPLDGFVGPGHVSCVIGSAPYEHFAGTYRKPVVIAGFEPLDLLLAVRMLLRQVNEGRHEVENEYTRAVTREGNATARRLIAEVFEPRRSFEWRGLGELPDSALRLKARYAAFDTERRFDITCRTVAEHRACACGAILRGAKTPEDCRLFGTACTPETPIGSCMVSSEGACAAHYSYGRYRVAAPVPAAGSLAGRGA